MAFSLEGIGKIKDAIRARASTVADAASEYTGVVSDYAHATKSAGLHTLGGAMIGGTVNAAAYANDGQALTGADSLGGAFMNGAVYGGAAGAVFGMKNMGVYARSHQMQRINGANAVGKTGIWSGMKGRKAFVDLKNSMTESRLRDREKLVVAEANPNGLAAMRAENRASTASARLESSRQGARRAVAHFNSQSRMAEATERNNYRQFLAAGSAAKAAQMDRAANRVALNTQRGNLGNALSGLLQQKRMAAQDIVPVVGKQVPYKGKMQFRGRKR